MLQSGRVTLTSGNEHQHPDYTEWKLPPMPNLEPLAARTAKSPWNRRRLSARIVAVAFVCSAGMLCGATELPTAAAYDDARVDVGAAAPQTSNVAQAPRSDVGQFLFLPAALNRVSMWPELTIAPSSASMAVGDTAAFVLHLESSHDIDFLAIDVRFDPNVIQVLDTGAAAGTQVQHGDFPVSPGNYVWSGVMERDGLLRYMLFLNSGEALRGSGDLLTFDMVAVAEGASDLAFDAVEVGYVMPRGGRLASRSARVEVARAYPPQLMDCPRSGSDYHTLSVVGAATDRPAADHPDLNLTIRGYTPAPAYRHLVEYNGAADNRAPQLAGLVPEAMRAGAELRFGGTHHVNDWAWDSDRRGGPIRDWPVTMAQLDTARGQAVRVPGSGYNIGDGMQVLVLFAQPDRLTLKYTRDDNVVRGYTLHVENVCVDPDLLSLYERLDREGRGSLPALSAGQALGVARSGGVRYSIRDTGQFMDPRARKDWWRGW